MKKIKLLFSCAFIALALTGCGGKEEPKEPIDLTGTWASEDNNGSYQEAIITNDTIEINWVSPDSTSLYWSGSFAAPTTTEDQYTWTSNANHEKTDKALLASQDDTKDFSYKNGVISYEASAMGTTKTVELTRKDK